MDQSISTLLIAGVLLSVFHALIPSHWLPIVAIGQKESWPSSKILGVTFLAGLAHVLSTLLLGLGLAALGMQMSSGFDWFTHLAAPTVLIVLGVFYIYRHYYHHHFHLTKPVSERGILISLTLAMFLSPCLEIEGYFLAAASYGWGVILTLALAYSIISILGMVLWVRLAIRGLKRLDWHAWEHNAGLITGLVLIFSGLILFVIE
ncbi:MAG: hypothetical protein R2792_04705 [Saprospiraceae bacterium]